MPYSKLIFKFFPIVKELTLPDSKSEWRYAGWYFVAWKTIRHDQRDSIEGAPLPAAIKLTSFIRSHTSELEIICEFVSNSTWSSYRRSVCAVRSRLTYIVTHSTFVAVPDILRMRRHHKSVKGQLETGTTPHGQVCSIETSACVVDEGRQHILTSKAPMKVCRLQVYRSEGKIVAYQNTAFLPELNPLFDCGLG